MNFSFSSVIYMNLPIIIAAILFIFLFFGAAYLIASSIKNERRAREKLKNQEFQLKKEAYESEILRELGERFGYELNEEKIVDIIAGSINKLFTYSTVSSILLKDERLVFKIHLEKSVSKDFITKVKESMLASLEALGENQIGNRPLEEEKTGTVIDDNDKQLVGSFFNIPIVINEKLTGILNISSTFSGLYKEGEMTILYKIVSQASNAVTKLRQVLENEKGRLASTLSSMSEGVVMVDRNTQLHVINPKARNLLNIQEEDPSFLTILESLKDKLDVIEKIKEATTENKLIVIDEVKLINAITQVFISPVKDKNNQLIGTVLVFHDITKVKDLERLREEFTAMLVHELRAPLTAVRGASSSLKSHLDEFNQEKKLEYLSMIENSSVNMIGIVSDLLDISKIEAGKFQINPSLVDLVETVRAKLKEFIPISEEKNLLLTDKLPNEKIEMNIDSQRIGQVVTNLISNAIKYTEKGEITLGLDQNDKEVKVFITDTGIGIDPENQKLLFSKFTQLASKKSGARKGTGLGLIITKGIVESHGGEVSLESQVGKGSTFSFSLPKN